MILKNKSPCSGFVPLWADPSRSGSKMNKLNKKTTTFCSAKINASRSGSAPAWPSPCCSARSSRPWARRAAGWRRPVQIMMIIIIVINDIINDTNTSNGITSTTNDNCKHAMQTPSGSCQLRGRWITVGWVLSGSACLRKLFEQLVVCTVLCCKSCFLFPESVRVCCTARIRMVQAAIHVGTQLTQHM